MRRTSPLVGALGATILAVLLTGCGDDSKLPQVQATPFSTGSVSVLQQGNANATIDPASVSFALDNARALVVRLTVRSLATTPTSMVIRASMYDPSHHLIGDATGGQVNVSPGATAQVTLNGPTPLGTIASATFELSAMALPT